MQGLERDRRRAHTLSLIEGMPSRLMNDIIEHVQENGSLISFCVEFGCLSGVLSAWIAMDTVRLEAYKGALKMREEYAKEAILHELRCIAHFDVRQLYNPEGGLKKITELDGSVAKAIASVDSFEVFQKGEYMGDVKKLKLNDKLKGLELLGKTQALFSERVVHEGKLTLEDLIGGSFEPDAE